MRVHPQFANIFDRIGDDMARRRLQQKGDLYKQGGYWKLRWREDALDEHGILIRVWSRPVFIGPCEGPARLTQKEARRAAWDQHLAKLDQNVRTPQSVMTVQEFVDRKFIPEHVDLLKKSGRIHYQTMFALLLPKIGALRLRDIRAEEAQRVVLSVLKQSYSIKKRTGTDAEGKPVYQTTTQLYSVQTAKHVRNALSAIFRLAIDKDWYTDVNPAQKVRLPEMKRKTAHALSIDQMKALLEALPSPAKEVVKLAVLTSMNIAEICGLQWKRVNLTDGWVVSDDEAIAPKTLIVRRQWRLNEFTSVKSPRRRRSVSLVDSLVDMLTLLKQRDKHTGPEDTVFVSKHGTPLDSHNIANRQLKTAGAALGMPWLSWHCFRRTTATIADQLGLGTGDRKSLLGHSTDAMAAHYVQESDQVRQRAILEQIADRLMNGRVQ